MAVYTQERILWEFLAEEGKVIVLFLTMKRDKNRRIQRPAQMWFITAQIKFKLAYKK